MTRPVKFLSALALILGAATSAMALPGGGSPAIQPAAGYASITQNAGNSLDITVKATKPGYGVFWVDIAADQALDAGGSSVGWATHPDKNDAVWRTNTGSGGGMLIPAGQAGYAGYPESGEFVANVVKPKKGPTPAATGVSYIIHVIDLATGNTFWAYPGNGTPPPPPNTPPTAQDDCTFDVVANTSININVLANDLPFGSTFTITGFTQPAHGAVVLNPDNTFTYTPTAGYSGPDGFTYTISNGAVCPGGSSADPYTLTSTVLANGDVQVVLRQSRNVVDNTYGVNSSPGYPRQDVHWFKDLVNSDHARFVLKNAAGNTVMDFYVDYLSASAAYPSGYGTLGVTGGDGSISVGSASNIASVTTTMTTNLNQSAAFYGYTTDSPAPESAFPTWDYVDGYTVVIKKAAFGASGFGSVTSPDVHNSPAKSGVTTPTTVPCTSTANVCLNVTHTPPPPPDCTGVLLFGPDAYLTTILQASLQSMNFPTDVNVYVTSNISYTPGEFTSAIAQYTTLHGAPPCAVMFDPEYVGPAGRFGGLDAADQATLKNLILGGMGFVYAEPSNWNAAGTNDPPMPLGQLPNVLPVVPNSSPDPFVLYDIVDTASPLVNPTIPGLVVDPLHPAFFGFDANSAGQSAGLTSLTIAGPVAGVSYENLNTVLVSSSQDFPGTIENGAGTGYTLDYQPIGGPTALQPGGRVAILGTDPFPKNYPTNTVVSPSILQLYFNALKYTSGS
jgi:hypothetical protein